MNGETILLVTDSSKIPKTFIALNDIQKVK